MKTICPVCRSIEVCSVKTYSSVADHIHLQVYCFECGADTSYWRSMTRKEKKYAKKYKLYKLEV